MHESHVAVYRGNGRCIDAQSFAVFSGPNYLFAPISMKVATENRIGLRSVDRRAALGRQNAAHGAFGFGVIFGDPVLIQDFPGQIPIPPDEEVRRSSRRRANYLSLAAEQLLGMFFFCE